MLEMRGITKSYGTVRANRGVDLDVAAGRVLGLLGENGSGKSTLMKILFGVVRPDGGTIRVNGSVLDGHGPAQAMAAGLGMIHQHFTLVEAMSVTENVMLGLPGRGAWLDPSGMAALIRLESAAYSLDVDPDARVADLSHGRRQRVEILKAILRGADVLILDEPTSNLSPPEVEGLLAILRRLRAQGRAVVFISHKLDEVLDVCDDIVVLRDGAVSGRCSIRGATRESLARMMVERDVPPPLARGAITPGPAVLRVSRLGYREGGLDRLADVDFVLRAGEVLAVAGIDGNGQSELVECLAGLRQPTSGSIELLDADVTGAPIAERTARGLAYVPVDRATTSLVPGMSVADNLVLRDVRTPPFAKVGILRRGAVAARAADLMRRFAIKAAGPGALARTLSGGNQQKIVLAREIGRGPAVLVAHQPVWGLDPGSTRFVVDQVLALRAEGGAVLYLSSSLEEVLMVGDRIAVMQGGRLSEPVPREEADLARIGLMMAGDAADVARAAA